MKIRRKAQCLLCGLRLGAIRSPFCKVDVKCLAPKMEPMIKGHKIHRLAWVREVRDGMGVSIGRIELI